MDVVTSSLIYAFGKGILCRLKDLVLSFEFPDLICISKASLYRVACRSTVLERSCEMIQAAVASDEALFPLGSGS
eukprot:6874509-Heterocapsa_arctica.AAC.1